MGQLSQLMMPGQAATRSNPIWGVSVELSQLSQAGMVHWCLEIAQAFSLYRTVRRPFFCFKQQSGRGSHTLLLNGRPWAAGFKAGLLLQRC